MSILTAERDAVLIVHPDAVATGLVALQQFEPVAARDRQIVQASSGIKNLQFALNDPPNVTRDLASGARVSFTKKICTRLVRK